MNIQIHSIGTVRISGLAAVSESPSPSPLPSPSGRGNHFGCTLEFPEVAGLIQRWIKSQISGWLTNVIKESPLPEGEGQGEGKERLMTKLWPDLCRNAESVSTRVPSTAARGQADWLEPKVLKK